MTYGDLKEILESLTDDQLKQPVVVFDDDDEDGKEIDSHEISTEDFYWEHHGDCLGNLEDAKKTLAPGEVWEEELEDLLIVPAGTVTLHI